MMGLWPINVKSNGPLGRGMGAPWPENDIQQFWAILEAINLVICTSFMPIVSDNEPIEVDDDLSHKANENKEQGKFQSRWASLSTWLEKW
jgi:hypothetical protein